MADERELHGAFRAHAGTRAEGVWSAPGRVNLIGEHVDYNAGLCLPVALPLRTRVAARRRGDRRLRMRSIGFRHVVDIDLRRVGPGRPKGWGAYVAGVLWAMEQEGLEVGGLDLVVDSTVPRGAGLSSSAALECAVGAAANDLFGLGLMDDDASRRRLAALCVRAENEIAGAATGGMDQAVALRSRPGHALLLDCLDDSVTHTPFDPAAAGLALLVTDTRSPHHLADGQYASRRRDCEAAAAALGVRTLREVDPAGLAAALARLDDPVQRLRARHVVTEIERVRQTARALAADRWSEVGAVLTAGHASLRDDFEVTVPRLDLAVETAVAAGALGARMTGGGFGGSTVALVPAGRVEEVTEAVRAAFVSRGWSEPTPFVVGPGAPATRDS